MWILSGAVILAQTDEPNEPAPYDPFFDYSELTQSEEEEKDLQFFYRGQSVAIELLGGVRHWTDRLPKYQSSDATYGFGLTYFFSLTHATYFSFATGDYALVLPFDTEKVTGNISMSFLTFGYKGFIYTDDWEWPFYLIKPFGLMGLGTTFRSIVLDSGDRASDYTLCLEIGLGAWWQFLSKSQFYMGTQVIYRYFNFYDENQVLRDPNNQLPSKIMLRGDSWDWTFVVGFGF